MRAAGSIRGTYGLSSVSEGSLFSDETAVGSEIPSPIQKPLTRVEKKVDEGVNRWMRRRPSRSWNGS